MASPAKPPRRIRGEIETLPSKALRVRVYAGIDPVSHKRHYLTIVIPPGPNAQREAERARTRFLNEVDERRNPRTKATVSQLMDRYLELLDAEKSTVDNYASLVRNHVRPLIGDVPLGRIGGEVLDSFYRELRTCRVHCRGAKYIEHRTSGPHDCDPRCRPHWCRPLANSSIR